MKEQEKKLRDVVESYTNQYDFWEAPDEDYLNEKIIELIKSKEVGDYWQQQHTNSPYYPFSSEEEWINYEDQFIDRICDKIINNKDGVSGNDKLQMIQDKYHEQQAKEDFNEIDIKQSAQHYADNSGQENSSEWDMAYLGYIKGWRDCEKKQAKEIDIKRLKDDFYSQMSMGRFCHNNEIVSDDIFEWFKPYLQPQESKWISVKDRLPYDNQKVLFVVKGKVLKGVFLKKDQWNRDNIFCDVVFHPLYSVTVWQPSPEPPKKK